MRLARPRFTILTLMIVVVIASLVLTAIAVYRQRIRRMIALQSAAADYENAKLTREVAEIAVLEYTEGIFKQDRDTLKVELTLAESDLERARNSSASDESAKLRVERAKQDLTTLEQDTKSRTVKELQSEVAKAQADELAKKATLDQLKAAVMRQWW
jgi:HlyD family secretion protein